MRTFAFNSAASVAGTLPCFGERAVKDEPMLFNCRVAAARELGGPITRAFIDALHASMRWDLSEQIIIDTRTHMLMPGWYPCIPGWHHDDVPRTRSDGQPNYDDPAPVTEHAMALVGGEICATEFALGECVLPDVPLGDVIYRAWHPIVERLVRAGDLSSWHAPSNVIIAFDGATLHQGTKATKGGWRWFGRATRGSSRVPTDEIRRQVQVYLENPTDGW